MRIMYKPSGVVVISFRPKAVYGAVCCRINVPTPIIHLSVALSYRFL